MLPIRLLAPLALSALIALAGASHSQAQCPSLPYNLANGQVADASQVMSNYEALRGCINAVGAVGTGVAGEIAAYGVSGNVVSGKTLMEILDSTIGSVRGSLLYRGATNWVALPPGTVGYVLQSGGSSGDPSWVAGGGGGGGISTIVGAGVASGASTVALPAVAVISRPALSAFTWVNQASATVAEHTNGPLVLKTTQVTSGNGINALVKSPLGADWTVTYQYALGNHAAGSGVDMTGVVIRNSVTGRLYLCGLNGTNGISVWAYSSPTAWNSGPGGKTINATYGTIWTRVQYVSATTTLSFYYSIDGFTWELIYSTSSPYVGVPDGYGIAVGTQGNTAGAIVSLGYMSESSP